MKLRLLAALAAACLSVSASDLDSAVHAQIKGFQGHISLAAKNLQTGQAYSLEADQPVRTASTIKLAIMIECFAEANENKLDLNEKMKLLKDEKVSGSGILSDLSDNDELPLRDMIDLMIVLSDNTATNLILNRIGGDAVNARLEQLGLKETRVMRKILGDRSDLKPFPTGITKEGAKPENKKWGIGRTSPAEMLTLIEKIYRGEMVSKNASEQMLTILKRQRDHNGIGRDMKDVEVANKSGALDALRADAGILYSKNGPIAMAIYIDGMPEPDWSPDNPGELMISKLSEILAEGLASHPSAHSAN